MGHTQIWHMTYIQKVTHDKIWKTKKFGRINKIKFSNWSQKRIKKKNSLVGKEINLPIEVKRELKYKKILLLAIFLTEGDWLLKVKEWNSLN